MLLLLLQLAQVLTTKCRPEPCHLIGDTKRMRQAYWPARQGGRCTIGAR